MTKVPNPFWQNIDLSIVEQDEPRHKVVLQTTFPQDFVGFQGHFEQQAILPAVMQIKSVVDFASFYFKKPLSLVKMQRSKFVAPIKPERQVQICLELIEDQNSSRQHFDGTSAHTKSSADLKSNFMTKVYKLNFSFTILLGDKAIKASNGVIFVKES